MAPKRTRKRTANAPGAGSSSQLNSDAAPKNTRKRAANASDLGGLSQPASKVQRTSETPRQFDSTEMENIFDNLSASLDNPYVREALLRCMRNNPDLANKFRAAHAVLESERVPLQFGDNMGDDIFRGSLDYDEDEDPVLALQKAVEYDILDRIYECSRWETKTNALDALVTISEKMCSLATENSEAWESLKGNVPKFLISAMVEVGKSIAASNVYSAAYKVQDYLPVIVWIDPPVPYSRGPPFNPGTPHKYIPESPSEWRSRFSPFKDLDGVLDKILHKYIPIDFSEIKLAIYEAINQESQLLKGKAPVQPAETNSLAPIMLPSDIKCTVRSYVTDGIMAKIDEGTSTKTRLDAMKVLARVIIKYHELQQLRSGGKETGGTLQQELVNMMLKILEFGDDDSFARDDHLVKCIVWMNRVVNGISRMKIVMRKLKIEDGDEEREEEEEEEDLYGNDAVQHVEGPTTSSDTGPARPWEI